MLEPPPFLKLMIRLAASKFMIELSCFTILKVAATSLYNIKAGDIALKKIYECRTIPLQFMIMALFSLRHATRDCGQLTTLGLGVATVTPSDMKSLKRWCFGLQFFAIVTDGRVLHLKFYHRSKRPRWHWFRGLDVSVAPALVCDLPGHGQRRQHARLEGVQRRLRGCRGISHAAERQGELVEGLLMTITTSLLLIAASFRRRH